MSSSPPRLFFQTVLATCLLTDPNSSLPMITQDRAEALIRAARIKATSIGIAVSIVVLDAGANLKAFVRMDGAWLGSVDVAMKKARTSALFEVETQSVWEVCNPRAQAH